MVNFSSPSPFCVASLLHPPHIPLVTSYFSFIFFPLVSFLLRCFNICLFSPLNFSPLPHPLFLCNSFLVFPFLPASDPSCPPLHTFVLLFYFPPHNFVFYSPSSVLSSIFFHSLGLFYRLIYACLSFLSPSQFSSFLLHYPRLFPFHFHSTHLSLIPIILLFLPFTSSTYFHPFHKPRPFMPQTPHSFPFPFILVPYTPLSLPPSPSASWPAEGGLNTCLQSLSSLPSPTSYTFNGGLEVPYKPETLRI